MAAKIVRYNKAQTLPSMQNTEPSKVSQMASKIFFQIKNIPTFINRKINASFNFLASHKFAIIMIAAAILFAPISIEATLAAIGLGTIKEAYTYYTKTVNYQFKLKAKAYIKALEEFNANFKDGKMITSKAKMYKTAQRFTRAYQSLAYMTSHVETASQLRDWQNYLISLNPKLVLDAKTTATLQNGFEILSKPQTITEHIDSLIKLIKQNLENNYFYAVQKVAGFCLFRNKKSELKRGATDILKKLPFVEKVLNKTQKDVLNDLTWSFTTQKIKRVVLSPFKAIARPFKAIARSKPVKFLKKPLKTALNFTAMISPVFVPAIIYGLYQRSSVAFLQTLTYPISLFTRATCYLGNKPSCNLNEAMNGVLSPATT